MAARVPDVSELVGSAQRLYAQVFGEEPKVAGCAPGRVNLIGEHTDYNQGFVLPMVTTRSFMVWGGISADEDAFFKSVSLTQALPLVTVVVGGEASDRTVTIVTATEEAGEPRRVSWDLSGDGAPLAPGCPRWANYVKGVMEHYRGQGTTPPTFMDGFRLVERWSCFWSNLENNCFIKCHPLKHHISAQLISNL